MRYRDNKKVHEFWLNKQKTDFWIRKLLACQCADDVVVRDHPKKTRKSNKTKKLSKRRK